MNKINATTISIDTFKANLLSGFNVQALSSKFACEVRLFFNNPEEIKILLKDQYQQLVCNIPVPFEEDGIQFIKTNDTIRSIFPYFIEKDDKILNYFDIMNTIIFDNYSAQLILPSNLSKGVSYYLCLFKAIDKNALFSNFRDLIKAINFILHGFTVHTTNMNSYIKNKRLQVIDEVFSEINDPLEEQGYHINKNNKYFHRGWTSIGLSDGTLAGKNFILTEDLRKYTPFGEVFHNPARNLYSTLNMEGAETALLQTESMSKLTEKGITRGGWNLFTMFMDTPLTWEDQILVHKDHSDKYIEHSKTYICIGDLCVQEGQLLAYGDILSIKNEKPNRFNRNCDIAWVDKIYKKEQSIGGNTVEAWGIDVIYRCHFKNGTKITNMSANKGIIKMMDLGYAIDPRTGEKRRIDVIVSGKAVLKRKNYGQVIEAIFNTLHNDSPQIISDEADTTEERLITALTKAGFSEDGTWECHTYCGERRGICGTVFWGVTHDADDTTWSKEDLRSSNNLGYRQAGLKFSPIEFKALETRFGKDNAIIREILTHAQGHDNVKELLRIAQNNTNSNNKDVPTLPLEAVQALNMDNGAFFEDMVIPGTIGDHNFYPEGVFVELPKPYMTAVDANQSPVYEGAYVNTNSLSVAEDIHDVYVVDKLYIPNGTLRKCWEHSVAGLYGLNPLTTNLNTVIIMAKKLAEQPNNQLINKLYYKAIQRYYQKAADILGGKKGEISVRAMSVRYPFSNRGTAALSDKLPTNTIEIHADMAKSIKAKEGDIVLIERFPCLGFMSLRPQKITITKDPKKRYVITVSGNSLGSLSLDFDGDTLYIAAFHSKEAIALLNKEWQNPSKICYEAILALNKKMGIPQYNEMSIKDYGIKTFEPLTEDLHAEIVGKLTGVKSNTGPVVALAYNIMRIMENTDNQGQEIKVGIELFLDKVANSVFKQKHGGVSLHEIVIEAICTGNVNMLLDHGFDPKITHIVCDTVKEKALNLGIKNLEAHFHKVKTEGGSNVINIIVRKQNKIYFACRSKQTPTEMLHYLREGAPIDTPSQLFLNFLQQ